MIIGITGTFGSGCSFVADKYFVTGDFKLISLSKHLRLLYKQQFPDQPSPTRVLLQNYGDELRKTKGSDYLARVAMKDVDKGNYVVDSIRNPAEIRFLESQFPEFYLLGVYADNEIRWERVKSKYTGHQDEFTIDERRDNEGNEEYGQQVEKCFERADYVLINNKPIQENNKIDALTKMQIERFLKLAEHKQLYPTEMETAMAIAQAASLRSSCQKRQVGAAIVDQLGGVIATGYNEVPPESESCLDMCGDCYRTTLRHDFRNQVSEIVKDEDQTNLICQYYKGNVKLMDYCRALHAEENAILSLIRNGSTQAISNATLYTTTFPCNLCANKIVSIGIKKVVYSTPYPMKEAKETLRKGGATTIPFSGITYHGYFKMEGKKT